MLNRRTLFSSLAGAVSAVSMAFTKTAQAKASLGDTPVDVEPRGKIGRLERLPTLNAESRNDFLTGVRNWRGSTLLSASRKRFNQIITEAGEDPVPPLTTRSPTASGETSLPGVSARVSHREQG